MEKENPQINEVTLNIKLSGEDPVIMFSEVKVIHTKEVELTKREVVIDDHELASLVTNAEKGIEVKKCFKHFVTGKKKNVFKTVS